jgi:hypothetical protein
VKLILIVAMFPAEGQKGRELICLTVLFLIADKNAPNAALLRPKCRLLSVLSTFLDAILLDLTQQHLLVQGDQPYAL